MNSDLETQIQKIISNAVTQVVELLTQQIPKRETDYQKASEPTKVTNTESSPSKRTPPKFLRNKPVLQSHQVPVVKETPPSYNVTEYKKQQTRIIGVPEVPVIILGYSAKVHVLVGNFDDNYSLFKNTKLQGKPFKSFHTKWAIEGWMFYINLLGDVEKLLNTNKVPFVKVRANDFENNNYSLPVIVPEKKWKVVKTVKNKYGNQQDATSTYVFCDIGDGVLVCVGRQNTKAEASLKEFNSLVKLSTQDILILKKSNTRYINDSSDNGQVELLKKPKGIEILAKVKNLKEEITKESSSSSTSTASSTASSYSDSDTSSADDTTTN